MCGSQSLNLAPGPVVVPPVHADRTTYTSWVEEHCRNYAVRWARLDHYDRFIEEWPSLQDWFDAPLRKRLQDRETVSAERLRTAARA